MNLLSNFSNRELNIWAHLLIDVGVAAYYYSKVWAISGGGLDANLMELVRVVVKIIIFTIVFAIIIFGAINLRGEEKPDERDYRIEAKANNIAYITLVIGVVLIMSQLFLNELGMAYWNMDQDNFITLTTVVIGHLLLGALILASVAKSISQLVLYRRDVLAVGNA